MTAHDPRKPIFDAVRAAAPAGLFNDPGNILALNNLLDAFTLRGDVTIDGDLSVTGKIEATGDVVGDGVSLKQHRHGGVQAGTAQSGGPA